MGLTVGSLVAFADPNNNRRLHFSDYVVRASLTPPRGSVFLLLSLDDSFDTKDKLTSGYCTVLYDDKIMMAFRTALQQVSA